MLVCFDAPCSRPAVAVAAAATRSRLQSASPAQSLSRVDRPYTLAARRAGHARLDVDASTDSLAGRSARQAVLHFALAALRHSLAGCFGRSAFDHMYTRLCPTRLLVRIRMYDLPLSPSSVRSLIVQSHTERMSRTKMHSSTCARVHSFTLARAHEHTHTCQPARSSPELAMYRVDATSI